MPTSKRGKRKKITESGTAKIWRRIEVAWNSRQLGLPDHAPPLTGIVFYLAGLAGRAEVRGLAVRHNTDKARDGLLLMTGF